MTAAHALDLALLEHAQKRDLRLGGQVPDFIQEDRAASAASKRPRRRCSAPVNAPFSCPNSSEAMSDGGMAAQFTRMNARVERRERL